MLSEIPKNKFTERAKKEVNNLLKKLNIVELTDSTFLILEDKLYFLISSLVNAKEDGETIDDELLKTYDLLIDILIDNEEDLDFLNQLFFN